MRGNMRSFGEILTSLREERGIYQKELAAILKVSVGTVSNYENNIHFPDQEALLQLADYFGVTVDYLLGRTSYRYSLDTLNEEYAPGMTVAELVDIVQHFSPQNTASFLDYIELLQLRQKAEDCSSTS
jgi:transcriptional regulator with XRE-family HTH domain